MLRFHRWRFQSWCASLCSAPDASQHRIVFRGDAGIVVWSTVAAVKHSVLPITGGSTSTPKGRPRPGRTNTAQSPDLSNPPSTQPKGILPGSGPHQLPILVRPKRSPANCPKPPKSSHQHPSFTHSTASVARDSAAYRFLCSSRRNGARSSKVQADRLLQEAS